MYSSILRMCAIILITPLQAKQNANCNINFTNDAAINAIYNDLILNSCEKATANVPLDSRSKRLHFECDAWVEQIWWSYTAWVYDLNYKTAYKYKQIQ